MNKYIPNLQALFKVNLGPEMLFGLLAVVILLLYSLSLGRTRAVISLLAIYVAFMFEKIFPFYDQIGTLVILNGDLFKVALFLFAYLISFLILNRSLIRTRLTLDETSFFWVVVFSVLQLGLLISVIVNIYPAIKTYRIPDQFELYISTPEALFFWSLVPLVLLVFLKRKKERKPRVTA